MLGPSRRNCLGDEVPNLNEERHCQRGKGDEEDQLSKVGAGRSEPFLGSE